MSRHTSFDELYTTYGALVSAATGRQWWRKAGIQARPTTPYATIFFTQVDGYEKPFVETVTLDPVAEGGERFEQVPWCTSQLEAQFDFYGDRPNNTALMAAQRLRSSLYLEARIWDICMISALAGRVQIQDLSTIFREDVEPRVTVRFLILANIVDPLPLADTKIFDISHQGITITHVGINEVRTLIDTETINDDEDDS